MDHTNYSRWLSVFVQELILLKTTNPELYLEFSKGFFSVVKTNGTFNAMGFDQFHEQNNKTVNSQSGYIDLINKEDTTFLKN